MLLLLCGVTVLSMYKSKDYCVVSIDLVSEHETGEVSDVTMGLTYTGGVCDPERSCVISEFGTTNAYGRPFPSAGALASLILTHEIGHR